MASHGYNGVELVEAVKDLDFISFLVHINGMGVWPPIFPIMEFPVFLIFGYDYSVARAFISILFAFCILAIFLVGSEFENSKGILVGAISVALMSLSPFCQLFGVLVMLEIPGTLLLLIAVLFYIKYVKTDSSKYLKLTCIFTIVLFFCKYNYGIMWIIPLVINEAWRESLLSRENIKNGFSKLIQFGRNKPFFATFLIMYICFLLSIIISGGFIWHIAGQKISVTSLGNPVFFLIIILIILFLIKPKRNIALVRNIWQPLVLKYRLFVLIVVLPIFIWMLVPTHIKGFFNFVQNRSSGIPFFSGENLLFYFRTFVEQYSTSEVIGLIVLALSIIPLFFLNKYLPQNRIIYLVLAIGLIVSVLHSYKAPRFFFTVVPFVWLACALSITNILQFISSRLKLNKLSSVIYPLLTFVCLAFVSFIGIDSKRLEAKFINYTVSENIRPVLDIISNTVENSKGTVILGHWNRLSPALVRWHSRISIPDIEESSLSLEPKSRTHPRFLDMLFETPDVEKILVLDLPINKTKYARQFYSETLWLHAIKSAIADDSRFSIDKEHIFPESGYRLIVYHKNKNEL